MIRVFEKSLEILGSYSLEVFEIKFCQLPGVVLEMRISAGMNRIMKPVLGDQKENVLPAGFVFQPDERNPPMGDLERDFVLLRQSFRYSLSE